MGLAARICLSAGVVGLGLCVVNQLSAPELTPALERAGVLASFLAVGLMLVSILWTRAVPVAPERVALEGEQGLRLADGLPEALREELAWGSRMLLTATPAASLLLVWRGEVCCNAVCWAAVSSRRARSPSAPGTRKRRSGW